MLASLYDWFRYHKCTVAAFALTAALVIGCSIFQPTVVSPVTGQKVSRGELQAEWTGAQAKFKEKFDELDRQENAINAGLQLVSQYVQMVPGPWQGVLTGALGLIAGGSMIDNRAKNSVIAGQKMAIKANAEANAEANAAKTV